jgi:hypothetical protein
MVLQRWLSDSTMVVQAVAKVGICLSRDEIKIIKNFFFVLFIFYIFIIIYKSIVITI